jgi:hypothetical protein
LRRDALFFCRVRPNLSAIVLAAGLLLVSAASASPATVGGTLRFDDGTSEGTMTYRASAGVANRVTIEPDDNGLVITDRAERVRATGDCVQRGRHGAACPWTEDNSPLIVLVRNGEDRVHVRGNCDRDRCLQPRVRGGVGDDVLTGGGELYGGRGDDLLRGIDARHSWDRLHGGPGRDRMEGGGAERGPFPLPDMFYDDETDAQAARDVIIAGRKARGHVDYSMRKRSMRIDLHDRRIAPEGDLISDVKSITTGSGNDVLIGTGGPNDLFGGPGRDRLHGRLGDDRLGGNEGNDALYGEAGDDFLAESHYIGETGGRDRLVGGKGSDEMRSLDSSDRDEIEADDVRCDHRDRPVMSDPLDRLRDCRRVVGWEVADLEMGIRPNLTPEGAEFPLRCGVTQFDEETDPQTGFTTEITPRCRGRLTLRGADGTEYGSEEFSFEMDRPPLRTSWKKVTVPLTDAGRDAIGAQEVIQMDAEALSSDGFTFAPAGYRALLL